MTVSSISPSGTPSYGSSLRAEETHKGPGQTDSTRRTDDAKPERDKSSVPGRDEDVETYGPTGRLSQSPNAPGQVAGADESGETSEDRSETSSQSDDSEYTSEEQKKIDKLENRDTEVRVHEQAHIAAGGRYVRGGAHFEYQTGPDGKKYAVGGEVSIDVSKESGDPQATIAKMQTIKRAALAPANPSSQDRAVAAKASRMEMEARSEAMAEVETDTGKNSEETTDPKKSQAADSYTATMDSSAKTSRIDLFM